MMPVKKLPLPVCLFLLLVFSLLSLSAENIVYPADANVRNLKTEFGAVGDGVTDDTTALQNAITQLAGGHWILYIPNGTYRVTGQLQFPENKFFLTFQGQSEANTVIRLADATFGFQNIDNPRPLIRTAVSPKGWTNDAFNVNFFNLTIDVGVNNSGAIGLLYIANNQGTIRNVTVRSSDPEGRGYAGIDMSAFSIPGPCLIQHVTIIGFEYGIRLDSTQYSATAEHVHLSGQRTAGIFNRRNLLNLRGITADYSRAAVPVIENAAVGDTDQKGMIVLIDSTFQNVTTASAAIVNDGDMFIRNVSASGYAAVLEEQGSLLGGSNISEYATGGAVSLFPSPQTSLNLPIEETPTVPWDDPSTWINVQDYGAVPGDGLDDSAAVQAAIDAATATNRTIYFPRSTSGPYQFGNTIVVRGYAQRIVGNYANMMYLSAFAAQNVPLFRLVDGTPEEEAAKDNWVVIDQIFFQWAEAIARQPTFFVNERSKNTLIRNSLISHGRLYNGTNASGKTFLDDLCVSVQPYDDTTQPLPGIIIGQNEKVWARQLNPETRGGQLRNDGGDFWVLGFKTEQYDSDFKTAPHIHTRNGGQTEVLGGYMHAMHAGNGGIDADAPPVFIIENSKASFTALENANNDQSYPIAVREIRGGVTRDLTLMQSPTNGSVSTHNLSFKLPLYVGYIGGGNQAPIVNLQSPLGGFARLTGRTLAIVADADDDGLPSIPGVLTLSWEQISGPSGVIFSNPAQASTDVTFPADGDYLLRLTANDGELARTVEVHVVVDANPPTPSINGLILRYEFDQTSGSQVLDTSGNGHHGTIPNLTYGNWLIGQGVIDGAYHFKEVPLFNPFVGSIEVSSSLPPTNQQTIAAWVRQDFDSPRSTQHVAHINGIDFYFNHDFNIIGGTAYYGDPDSWSISTRGFQINKVLPAKGSWMHVAVTFDGDDPSNPLYFYVNGVQTILNAASYTGGNSYLSKSNVANSWIGRRSFYQSQGMEKADIDQLLAYNRVLSPEEIQTIYASNIGNIAPIVNAGNDVQTETGVPINLQGSVTDDGLPSSPGALSIEWTKVTGPGGITWEDINSPTTEVNFVNAGTYVFRLSSSDGAAIAFDTVTVTVTGDNMQLPPVASGVTVSGTAQVGKTLSMSYTFSDANDDLENTGAGGTAFRWLRGDTPDGSFSPILGAINTTYKLTSADYGKYIRAEVTPRALEEPYAGDPALSSATGPIARAEGLLFPVSQGLLGHWNFEDRFSPTDDLSGNGYHSLLTDGASFASTGIYGSALIPVATGGASASSAVAVTNDFTFSVWVRHNAYTTNTNEVILGKDWNTFQFYMATGTNNGQLRIQFRDTDNAQKNANYNNAIDFIPAGQWVHLAAVREGTEMRLYVNGSLRTVSWTSGAGTNPIATSAQNFRIGHFPGASHWDGQIDQVSIYNRALSVSEIAELIAYDPSEAPEPSEPDPSYTTWAVVQFAHLAGGSSHPDAATHADRDGDGVVNFLEYALNGNPNAAAPALWQVQMSGKRLQISFLRARAELTYTVEASNDLQGWTTLVTNPGNVSEDTLVTATDSIDIDASTPRRFLRLRVTDY